MSVTPGDRITVARLSKKGRLVFTQAVVQGRGHELVWIRAMMGRPQSLHKPNAASIVKMAEAGVTWAPGWGRSVERQLKVAHGLRGSAQTGFTESYPMQMYKLPLTLKGE